MPTNLEIYQYTVSNKELLSGLDSSQHNRSDRHTSRLRSHQRKRQNRQRRTKILAQSRTGIIQIPYKNPREIRLGNSTQGGGIIPPHPPFTSWELSIKCEHVTVSRECFPKSDLWNEENLRTTCCHWLDVQKWTFVI